MKKSNLFEKAKIKSGVIEGGINELVKIDDSRWKKDLVRVCCWVPKKLQNRYKALLCESGLNIQGDLLGHIQKTVSEMNKNTSDKSIK